VVAGKKQILVLAPYPPAVCESLPIYRYPDILHYIILRGGDIKVKKNAPRYG
jgi:hypothetical protein